MTRRFEEDSMDSEFADRLPPRPYERWFDLCFRLIIVVLAGVWLLTPPAAGDQPSAPIKAATVTR
jgi:hypothetical protein